MGSTPMLGPVEFLVLTFPGTAVDAAVTDALAQVVGDGRVTLLDLVVMSMDLAGAVTELEIDDDLAEVGLTGLTAADIDLVSDDDLDVVRSSMQPGSTALVLVFEETWARRLSAAVHAAKGEVTLHVQVPRDAVDAAIAAAAKS
ncbi:DUF6325 family protein [Nocardia sp. NPDC057663]|uniref:DUF6325 family protein n=1 Tax=Nocardia sp. NPDC057663 TaxID=3346201 RepID=UPI00366EFF31